jgi:internalin A
VDSIKIFCCYASKDKGLEEQLVNHLEPMRRTGQVTIWHDRELLPGMEWKQEIDKHLNTSDIVLLLISPNFMSSDYCYSIEMKKALERHERGEARVIPVILRSVNWKETPIDKLQAFPPMENRL